MRTAAHILVFPSVLVLAGCGGTGSVLFAPLGASGDDGGASAPPPADLDAAAPPSPAPTSTPPPAAIQDASDPVQVPDATVAPPPDAAPPDAGADAGDVLGGLTSITSHCNVASKGTYATDRSSSAAVDVCKLNGAFFWTADLAVDCDGQQTAECNPSTDPTFSAQTSVTQSNGKPLIASQLPYVVIPLASARFDYRKQGIAPGALAIVLYGGQVVYGVFGDEGPAGVIGEASYAMAQALGLPPSPKNGGTAGQVTYIVLTGSGAVVSPVEDPAAAKALAATLVPQLLKNN